ncbi:MAG: hypothetical protein ABI120_13065 [Gemmatimonadaceae bacterium]
MPGTSNWLDALVFIGFFVAARIVIVYALTRLFIMTIPDGDLCPICDGYTLPIERNGWWRLLGPYFRRSWCLDCQWEGVLRRTKVFDPTMLSSTQYVRKRARNERKP